MAGRGSVKLSIYSTFKDDGTKAAEKAIERYVKKFGELDKATGQMKVSDATRALLEQSAQADIAAAKWQGYSDKLASAGEALTKYVSAAAAASIGASVKLASDYEDAFAKVKTIMDKQALAPAELSRQILDLSTATGKAATELSEATYQALSASVDTSQVVGFVEQSVALAKAGFTDTTTAVDTLTTVINAYKLSADEAAAISDKLVQAQNDGKTTVGELGASMGSIIPTAAALNVNLDNVLTSYALMTKQGIKTSDATTALKNTLSELSDEGSGVAQILKEKTGKSFGELMDDGMSLGDVLGILYDHVDGNGEAFKNLWGNMRAGTGALAIANAGTAGFSDELGRMQEATGNVSAALADLETPSARANKAINAVKNTGIELGEEFLGALAPTLEKTAKAAQGLYQGFSRMDQGTKQAVAGVMTVAAAAGPAVLGLSKIAGGVSAAMSAYGRFAATMATWITRGGAAAKAATVLGTVMSGPVVAGAALAAVAVAALVKAYSDWKKHTDDVEAAQHGLVEAVTSGSPSLSKASADMSAYGQASQRTRVDIADVTRAQAELAAEIEKRNSEAQAEINRLEGARAVLSQYMNQTSLTAQEQGKLRAAVEYVNQACGTQYEVVDAANGVIADETGAVLDNTAAIDDNIRALQERIRTEALSENLSGLYKQQADDIAAVAQAHRDYKAAAAELHEVEEAGLQVGTERWDMLNSKVEDAARAVEEAEGNYDATTKAIAMTELQLGNLNRAAAGADMTLGQLASMRVEITQIVPPEQLEAFCQQLDESGISVEQFSDLTDKQLMALAESYDGSMDSIIAAAKRMGVDVPKATSSGMTGATASVTGETPRLKGAAETAMANVTAAARRTAASVPSLTASGMKSATASVTGETPRLKGAAETAMANVTAAARRTAASVPSLTASGMSASTAAIDKANPSQKAAAERTMANITAAAKKMGIDVPAAAAGGMSATAAAISSSTPSQQAAASRVTGAVLSTFGLLKGSAPAEGSAGAQGFASGIASGRDAVSGAASTLAGAAEAMKNGDKWSWGNEAGNSFAQGLRSSISSVIDAASEIANNVYSYLGHSVAKKGALHAGGFGEALWGQHAAENFARGLSGSTDVIARASSDAAAAAASGFQAIQGGRTAAYTSTGGGQGVDYDRLARVVAQEVARVASRLGPDITINESNNPELTASRVAARLREEAICA